MNAEDFDSTMERTIRDMAGTVITQVDNRKTHPSYGYSKTMIRTQYDRLEGGAVGLYMVVTGQATHTGVPALATFFEPETTDRVRAAKEAFNSL